MRLTARGFTTTRTGEADATGEAMMLRYAGPDEEVAETLGCEATGEGEGGVAVVVVVVVVVVAVAVLAGTVASGAGRAAAVCAPNESG